MLARHLGNKSTRTARAIEAERIAAKQDGMGIPEGHRQEAGGHLRSSDFETDSNEDGDDAHLKRKEKEREVKQSSKGKGKERGEVGQRRKTREKDGPPSDDDSRHAKRHRIVCIFVLTSKSLC